MPSTPVRPLSNHLVINTHNLSQAHNRGSPRSANANSAMTFKDPHRPPMEKRHSYGPSSLGFSATSLTAGGGNGGGANGNGAFHGHGHLGHGHSRSRQNLALTILRILAGAPGLLGMMYSLSAAWDSKTLEQQQRQWRNQRHESIGDEFSPLTRSDFWVASLWASIIFCGLSIYWAFLLTTATIQRLLQSYRPPNVVLRIMLAHLVSWIMIGFIIHSRPATEPTRPWIIITSFQALFLLVIVYLPWIKTQMQLAGVPMFSERITSHALEDGFMGREISGQSVTRFLVAPLIIVGLCSWMLIITRGHQSTWSGRNDSLVQDPTMSPSTGRSPTDVADTVLNSVEDRQDSRMVISMIVLSSATPQGFLNRKLFRETTLKLFPSPRNKAVVVKYRFIIGDPLPAVESEINQEYRMMGDLLIVSAPDTPDGKSAKLYKAIEWAAKYDFDYLVKTDDDVLVRVDTLSGELYKQGRKPYFWKGLVFKNVPNTRLDDMDLREMPKFTDGTLTTLSRDIVQLLAMPAPRYFVANSAQSLGIWLHGYGIKPVHDKRIQPGAFVCEEDLIAKHFDNEPSLLLHPREDPVKMVERINVIRAELKQNKNNPQYRTTVSICDPLIQKRCAMCYSCQGRASNWKLMGFDCKQGGVIVGDRYRKPELLNAKQMDELVNRPPGGISDELETVALKDYRPGSRYRQRIPPESQENSQGMNEDEDSTEQKEEEALEETGNDDGAGGEDESWEEDGSGDEEQSSEGDLDEQQLETQDEEEALDQETGEGLEDEEEGSEQENHDESEMQISDQEVDYLERRHDEETLPAALKPTGAASAAAAGSGRRKSKESKKKRSKY
ncbi:Beta-1,3-galactosyltransferase 6 [Haplosporangium sp. Z 767]|nr:Beta-1,3-galactosyltransferase 6 [Haplosporangium sp. Z 767]